MINVDDEWFGWKKSLHYLILGCFNVQKLKSSRSFVPDATYPTTTLRDIRFAKILNALYRLGSFKVLRPFDGTAMTIPS